MIYKSFSAFPLEKTKRKLKYEKLGIDSSEVVRQRDLVSKLYLTRAKEVNSVFAFQDFIDKNKWSTDIDSAIFLRDELAFKTAMHIGGSKDYRSFISTYPNTIFLNEAQALMDEALYKEQTLNNNFIDFVNFVKNYPDSPYRGQAEDKIYQISTNTASIEAYRTFIIDFPSNRNVKQAWKHLYNAKMIEEYSSRNIMSFKEDYPDYPYQKELQAEYNMADKVLLPVRDKGSWGYCDLSGNTIIPAKYESVEWYSEGLAVVRINEKFGYINKLGNLVIPPGFDDALPFSEGHALIEINEKYGMIDRNGDFVIPAEYEDLGVLSNGLCYYQADELYGYFDAKGKVRLEPQFTEAFDFEGDYAVVSKNDYFGIIDQDTLLSFEYDYIGRPIEGVSIIEKDETYNYFDTSGTILLGNWVDIYPEYRQLGIFKNGYAKIKYEDGFNLIDSSGVKLFRKGVEDIGVFGDLIALKKKGKWGYCDVKGLNKIEHNYSYAYTFHVDKAIVQQDPFYGLINSSGEFIIAPLLEELKMINDSVYLAKSVGEYGLLTDNGDTLLNFQYINIEPIDNLVVKLEEDGNVFYFDLKRLEFIRNEE
jgi:hypothetical protein